MSKYAGLVRPLSIDEYEILKEDIEKRGITTPITTDMDGEIVDGFHRARIAEELGIECPSVAVDGTEKELKIMAITLNYARRHLDEEDKKILRGKLRELGVSYRDIAKITKEHERSVRRHIQSAAFAALDGKINKNNDLDENVTKFPPRTIGADGKSRVAKKPSAPKNKKPPGMSRPKSSGRGPRLVGMNLSSKMAKLYWDMDEALATADDIDDDRAAVIVQDAEQLKQQTDRIIVRFSRNKLRTVT